MVEFNRPSKQRSRLKKSIDNLIQFINALRKIQNSFLTVQCLFGWWLRSKTKGWEPME